MESCNVSNLEWLRCLYGDPMAVFSSLLRSVIIASPNKVFDAADFSAIEARVVFWLAKHENGLQAFREGRDLYRELATRIFNTSIDKVSSDQRFLGKTAILGCSYQMGWKKFRASCQAYGQEVSDELAQAAVTAYRETHKPVTVLWDMLGRAAIAAVENLGKRFTIYRTAWWVKGGILWCQLPSGRRLAYPQPNVRWEPTEWGEKRQVLQYFGVNATTKRWGPEKTYGGKLTENVVQAIARDVMAAAMLRIDAAGWEIVLHAHDEIVGEIPKTSKRTNAEFCALMSEVPEWAEGLPVKVEGWRGERYKK